MCSSHPTTSIDAPSMNSTHCSRVQDKNNSGNAWPTFRKLSVRGRKGLLVTWTSPKIGFSPPPPPRRSSAGERRVPGFEPATGV